VKQYCVSPAGEAKEAGQLGGGVGTFLPAAGLGSFDPIS